MSLPAIDAYPDALTQHGATAEQVRDTYLGVVKNAILNHPRSLQKKIGPSELAHPCSRRIGYKLLDVPEANPATEAPWLPTIGTGVHGWLEEQFTQANSGQDYARWLVELRVSIGEVLGIDITGSLDLYDRATATVVDHKIVGPTTLKKYKSKGPGDQYEGQIMTYGRGLIRRGLPVKRVMIAFLPRNAELRDAFFWSAPYDAGKADAVLQRAEGIALTCKTLGPAAPALLGTADAYCTRCPWYRAGSADLATGCPGDPGAQSSRRPAAPALTLSI